MLSFRRHVQTFVILFKYKSKNPHFLQQIDVKQVELNRKPGGNKKH